jgi:hypothetical protein
MQYGWHIIVISKQKTVPQISCVEGVSEDLGVVLADIKPMFQKCVV